MTTDTRTFEQRLRDAGYITDPTPRPRLEIVPAATPITGSTNDRYLARAVTDEIDKVLHAVEGTRNHTLNTAAYSLGQLIAGAGLDRHHVETQLAAAAAAAGLDATEIRKTITSGLTAGEQEPRAIPELHITHAPPIPPFDVDPDAVTAHVLEHFPRLDWQALWADESEEEWIVEPLLPARRLVALYSAPKVGKSLLMLEIAVAVAQGAPILGVTPDRPRKVLYIDFENDPKADIRERLQAMGVRPRDLSDLYYLSFPSLAALDSERGGQELLAAVAVYACEVVIVDTVSRAITGEENENDTWLSFYRHTGLKLKKAGIALVRLDHSGKDETKGQRGGSAKSGDVDAVWRISRVTDDTYKLDCEAARMPVTEKTLVLRREERPYLHHAVEGRGIRAAVEAKTAEIVTALDGAEVPNDAGKPHVRRELKKLNLTAQNSAVEEAIRQRRMRVISFQEDE